jgi:hypothetical protein
MADHAWISTRVRWIKEALDRRDTDGLGSLVAGLAKTFAHHAAVEEAGLFTQLRGAGEALEEVAELIADHRRIVAGLTADTASSPDQLRRVLDELVCHAQVEDNDLFPYAMQMLPNERWGQVEEIHQRMMAS